MPSTAAGGIHDRQVAVEGVYRLPFGLGVAHYDQPPPDSAPDVEVLLATAAAPAGG